MKHHVIERFKGEPLEFDGELLCQSKISPTAGGARWFQLEVLRTAAQDLVAVTRMCTQVDGEQSVTWAERLQNSTDVENFFFAFDPEEYLQRGNVAIAGDERDRYTADLYSEFEMAVHEVLADVPAQEKESHVADAQTKERDDGALAG